MAGQFQLPQLCDDYSFEYLGQSITRTLALDISYKQWQTLENYVELLMRWNKTHNLTAITKLKDIWIKHIFDSMAVCKYIYNEPILDIGTGAGLPGIVIAIVNPNLAVHLVETKTKKISFLFKIKSALKLDNVAIMHSRVEDYCPNTSYKQVIARSVSSLNNLVDLSRNLLAKDGVIWAMKFNISKAEINGIPKNYHIKKTTKIFVPYLTDNNGESQKLPPNYLSSETESNNKINQRYLFMLGKATTS